MASKSLNNTAGYKCSVCIRNRQMCEEIVRQQFENKRLLMPCEGLHRESYQLIPIYRDDDTV